MEKKKNHHANFMQILKVFWFHKTIKRNIQMNLITKRTKNENMMLAVVAIN